MKFKGKVIQIIPEEKTKSWGFRRMPNHDYFNIVELSLWKHQQEPAHKLSSKLITWSMIIGFILLVAELIMSFVSDYKLPEFVSWIPLIFIFAPIVLALLYNYFWDRKNWKPWYFDYPMPIQKPHNLQLNDEVEISLDIKKVKEMKEADDRQDSNN